MNHKIIHILKTFAPFAIIIVSVCFIIYTVGHQIYRSSANDPQIQASEDLAAQAADKKNIALSSSKVDIKTSLSSFVIVFNEKGELVQSNATLNGSDPTIPQGVLENAKSKGQNRITWQPEDGVRLAIVVTYYKKDSSEGYILVGRSLRETEKRIGMLGIQVIGGMFVSMLGVLAAITLVSFYDLKYAPLHVHKLGYSKKK